MNEREHVARLMEKAEESLDVARSLTAEGHHGFAASRAYYAMFYAATAVLLSKGLSFSKHTAVIAEFNRGFVKTGVFGPEMFKSLQLGFDLRSQGDYSIVPVSHDRAESLIEKALAFLAALRGFLAEGDRDA